MISRSSPHPLYKSPQKKQDWGTFNSTQNYPWLLILEETTKANQKQWRALIAETTIPPFRPNTTLKPPVRHQTLLYSTSDLGNNRAITGLNPRRAQPCCRNPSGRSIVPLSHDLHFAEHHSSRIKTIGPPPTLHYLQPIYIATTSPCSSRPRGPQPHHPKSALLLPTSSLSVDNNTK